MKFCLITAIVGFAGANLDDVADGCPDAVHLDIDKLTDFTAEFNAGLRDVPYGPRMAILMNGGMQGKVQLNLLDEKVKFSYEVGDDWQLNANSPSGPPSGPLAMLIPGEAGAKGEIVIDGPAGLATITQTVRAQSGTIAPTGARSGIEMDMNSCFHVKLPAGLMQHLPQGGMLKQRAEYMAPRIEQELNRMPHNQTADGDLFYMPTADREAYYAAHHYPSNDVSFTIEPDGTPVSWHAESICDEVCQERYMPRFAGGVHPSMSGRVHSFTAGAGDVTPLSCVDSSVADLSEHPGIMHAAVVSDTFMEQISKTSGLNLPSLQPLIEQQTLLAENVNDQGAQQQSWMVALLAGVAGMTGGAVVLALDKVFRRQGRDLPLLSEA